MNSLFGTKHLILIAASITLIVVLFILSKKLSFAKLLKAMLYIGITSETIKIFYYIIRNEDKLGGVLPKSDLPFHLCSIQIVFILILNLTNNEKIRRILLSFMYPSCLFGGIAAILIATHSSLNGMWIITAQYFIYHIAITVFALNICTREELKLTIKDYFSCLKFLVAVFFFAVYINSIVYDGVSNINFMYVVSPPATGLPFLNEKHGWFTYIIHYACLIIICVSGAYIKPIISGIKQISANKKQK